MADVNYSKSLTAGANENIADVQTMFNEAKAAINDVDSANVTDGTITDADLASPNNSVYRTLFTSKAALGADALAASGASTYLMGHSAFQSGVGLTPYTRGGMASPAAADADRLNIDLFDFDDADYAVNGKTHKLRVRAFLGNGFTAWSSVTATVGLYPVTFAGSGSADIPIFVTPGTVVSGSTVALANPASSGPTRGNSGVFTPPSDGLYALGFTLSAALTDGAVAILGATLQSVYT